MHNPNFKKLIVVLLICIASSSFAQSLSFDNLKVAIRCHKVLTNNLLVNKGFKEAGFKAISGDTVIFYNKGLLSNQSYSETCVTGLTLQGPDDKKKHMSLTYMNRSLLFMTDFARQIPEDMELKSKKDGIYYYENSEMYLQITMTLDPKNKPFTIYILDKIPYQF